MIDKERKKSWDRFIQLGEIIGDGDHDDLASLKREYKALAMELIPEYGKIQRDKQSAKTLLTNKLVKAYIDAGNKCPYCKGPIEQTRSGAMKVCCKPCNKKFTLKEK